jgi:23S rRNA pseudouridine1911/1915/1917 synthase
LIYHCPDLEGVGGKQRPGIVHRLDKDTSGILLIAKNSSAHAKLSAQFKDRKIKKEYLALVWGRMPALHGRIDLPIGRHPKDRKKMSVHSYVGRNSETLWKVEEEYKDATLLRLDLKTGRTHQIRVHCAAIHHPVLGDPVYGKGKKPLVETKDGLKKTIPRQMLHAWRISFEHPEERKSMTFQTDIPEDMKEVVGILRQIPAEAVGL